MTTRTAEPVEDRQATISRVMDVPAKCLFLAHSRPEHLMRWFGPPDYPVTHCEADFRVGGRWRMIMTGPDGKLGPPFGGTYHEITPYSRIVWDDAFEDGKGGEMNLRNDGPMLLTTTFDERDGRTTVKVTILFPSVAMKAEYLGVGMLEGFGLTLGQLEAVAQDLAQRG